MTWTYDNNPGTSTAAERRDAVRYLVGDTDTGDQKATDEEIAFALSEAGNSIYQAAAITARAVAGKYAVLVDTQFEGVSTNYSQLRDNFYSLAIRLDTQAKKYGSSGIGTPRAGGISISGMDSARSDDDRPQPSFRRRQFENPPRSTEDEDIYNS